MKSQNIVFPDRNRVEVWKEVITAPGSQEILCAAEASLISVGTETYCLRGEFDSGTNWERWVRFPFRPGYSMAARVLETGKDVADFREGDRVVVAASHQQLFKISTSKACLIPEGISDENASWSSLATTAQLGIRRAQLQLGETVGVVGLGMLGQLVVQYLTVSGVREIIAIDHTQYRLSLAKEHGADHILNVDVQVSRDEVKRITDGRMLDVVFDVTGHPEVLAYSDQLLRKLGRIILLGDTPTPSRQKLGPGVVSNSISILGIHGSMYPEQASVFNPWTRKEMTILFFDYLLQGRMRVSDLITHRFRPIEAPEVYAKLMEDRSEMMGVLFDWASLY